jgi:hypothetical protein
MNRSTPNTPQNASERPRSRFSGRGKAKVPPKVSERLLPGRSYKHNRSSFRLFVPNSMLHYQDGRPSCRFMLGNVEITLRHLSRTFDGDIPASWMVDLNADEEGQA